jgi:cytosine/adenosine deaminase-related metal-dependent hydrolase
MAATQLIHDTTIVTADDVGSILYDAALAVRDGRIAALGPTTELTARYPDAERVDGRGRAVFPGFANTHTHLSRVLARGIYEDLSPPHTPPFTGGLAPLPLPALTPDEERVMALLGALSMDHARRSGADPGRDGDRRGGRSHRAGCVAAALRATARARPTTRPRYRYAVNYSASGDRERCGSRPGTSIR